MITQKEITKYFERLLGTMEYNVGMDVLPTLYENDNRIPVALSMSQRPLSVADAEVHQADVTFIFDVPVAGNGEREMITAKKVKDHVAKTLLGVKTHVITGYDGIGYAVTTEFTVSELSDVRKDTGQIRANFTVTGSLLATAGALMFGTIKYYVNGVRLITTAASSHIEKGARRDQNLSTDTDRYELHELNKSNTYSLTCLYRGQEIEQEFLKIIDGDVDTVHHLDTEYALSINYGGFVSRMQVKLVSGDISGQQGALLSYTLTFERV